jgi:hypothetical protein
VTQAPFVTRHRAHLARYPTGESAYVTDVSFVHLGETYGARLPGYEPDPTWALSYVAQAIQRIEAAKRQRRREDYERDDGA